MPNTCFMCLILFVIIEIEKKKRKWTKHGNRSNLNCVFLPEIFVKIDLKIYSLLVNDFEAD